MAITAADWPIPCVDSIIFCRRLFPFGVISILLNQKDKVLLGIFWLSSFWISLYVLPRFLSSIALAFRSVLFGMRIWYSITMPCQWFTSSVILLYAVGIALVVQLDRTEVS